MTDAEQIEAWRSEFESEAKKLYPFNSLDRLPDNSAYIDPIIFHLEKGFLMAKRSQPVIFLPCKTYDDGHPVSDGYNLALKHCKEAILSSGYSYESEG